MCWGTSYNLTFRRTKRIKRMSHQLKPNSRTVKSWICLRAYVCKVFKGPSTKFGSILQSKESQMRRKERRSKNSRKWLVNGYFKRHSNLSLKQMASTALLETLASRKKRIAQSQSGWKRQQSQSTTHSTPRSTQRKSGGRSSMRLKTLVLSTTRYQWKEMVVF